MKMKRWENNAFKVLKVDARFSQEEFVEPVGEDEHIIEIYVHFTVDANDDGQRRRLNACAEEYRLQIGYREGKDLEHDKHYIKALADAVFISRKDAIDLNEVKAKVKVNPAPITRIYTPLNQYVFQSRRGDYYSFRGFVVDSPSTRGLIMDLNVLVKNSEAPRGVAVTYEHFFSILESLDTFRH